MNELLYGKPSKEFFNSVIYPNLGANRKEVIVGPAAGVDNCVVKIGSNEVMVATTDPLSYIAELGPEDSAWLSVNLIASDLSTSGFQPQYLMLDFNMPASMSDSTFEAYWNSLSKECERHGIAIVGGHTGRFEGIESTVIGGGVMISIGSSRSYLTSSGGKEGDKLVLTKGAAIAATGILSRVFPEEVAKRIGEDRLSLAQKYFHLISTVKEALASVSLGVHSLGVSAMHDCTEGGVFSGIHELAAASSLGAIVDKERILVSSETKDLCDLFEIDPYFSLGEGALVIACNPEKAEQLVSTLRLNEVNATIVGELRKKSEGITILDAGDRKPMFLLSPDPYWQAYYNAKKKGWK